MRKRYRVVALASVLALAACTGDELTRTFGLTRDAPDEFQVTTRAPLSMPPDFTLRPPRPGAARPQELSGSQQAEAALVPESLNTPAPRALSPGQQALVAAAGRPAPANIRAEVNSDAAIDTPSRSFADRLMFWRPTPAAGTAVDPAREAQRLRQNAALGQDLDSGDTPIIQRRRAGLFSGLF
ncbi:MAG: DUF3035 domain-containing protein [Acetobacteraceae bacterium]|nr:DUF3035 domain-containing protein [Acetobacteraceae bacterium]